METEIRFQTEEQFQAYCFMWFDREYPRHRKMLFAVFNNQETRLAGNRAKAVGVQPGVSDFIFIGFMFTAFIELKLPGKKQQYDQIVFEQKVKERQHEYYVVETFSKFVALIKKLIMRTDGE